MFEALVGVEHIGGNSVGPLRGIEWLAQRLAGVDAPRGCFDVTLP
jgi:hypothetical protein